MFENIVSDVDVKKWEKHPRLFTAGDKLPSAATATAEGIERRKFRSNKPYFSRFYYYNLEATRDGIKHWADGIGDTNPLFTNLEYAEKSKYGKVVGPGTYLYTVCWVPQGSGMTGVHAWYSGGDWEWYRPVMRGDSYKVVCILRDMVVKKGRMTGGGNIYVDYTDVVYLNQDGLIVGKELQHTVWGEREKAGESGKYRGGTTPKYSKKDWARILEAYEREEIRGSVPRYWEDVKVGDKVGPMIRGPLRVVDEIVFLMGAGSQLFKAHKNAYEWERKHPGGLEYVEETGDADVPELVHIFDSYAHTIGIERAYDYGCQRMSWLGTLLTNWMGDDGFLSKMSGDLRVFNQIGDVLIFEGKVVKKYVENGKCCVDIEIQAKNQKDEVSMPTKISTVILPSTQYGPVVYPEPSPQLTEEVKKARPLDEMIKEGIL